MEFLSGPAQSIDHERYWQFAAVDHLQQFFSPRNKSPAQVAIAWFLSQSDVTSAIVEATRRAAQQSLPATGLTLDSEEMEVCAEVRLRLPRLAVATR